MERQEVAEAIQHEVKSGLRPVTEGITYDRKGTFSCEQGLNVQMDENGLVIGYHVVDASLIPEAGYSSLYAYGQQTHMGKETSLARLFGDRLLYRHLSLGKASAADSLVPSISFYFRAGDEGLQFQSAHKTLFRNIGQLSYEDTMTDEPLGIATAIVETIGHYATANSLVDAEQYLSHKAAEVSKAMLARIDVPLLQDRHNQGFIHRPLRNWADFKNLSMISQVLDGQIPLHTAEQFKHMQDRAKGKTKRYEQDDIRPDPAARLLLRLLMSPDASRRRVTSEDFAMLVDHFDPDAQAIGNDPLLVNILDWAQRNDFVTMDETEKSVSFTFHNIEKLFEISRTLSESMPQLAYEGLVTYLQRYPRQTIDITSLKNRQAMRDLRIKAMNEVPFTEDEWARRTLQTAREKLLPKFSGGRKRR